MSSSKINALRKTLFIFLLVVAVLVAFPLEVMLSRHAQASLKNFKQNLIEQAGIEITYKTLSPSILSSFYVRGVVIKEYGGNDLLRIEKIKINYKIIPLLKGDFQKGFGNIVVDGINLDVAEGLELLSRFTGDKKQEEEKAPEYSPLDIKKIMDLIPRNIKLKNISLSYANEFFDALVMLREISLTNNVRNSNLGLSLSSRARLNIPKLNESISAFINLSGTIQDELDNSQLTLRINNLTDGNYTLNRLNLLATYNDRKVDLHTIQSVIPLFVNAEYNLDSGIINAQVKSDNLRPVTIVSFNKNQKNFEKFRNLIVDTDSFFSCDLNTRNYDFGSKGNVSVPKELFSGGVALSYDLSGNQEKISLSKFEADGEDCSASVNLDFIYKTLQLSGMAEVPYFVLPNRNVISTDVYFDPLDKGFMAFAPQFFIGSKSLTAIQLKLLPQQDSYDYTFEAYDYSNVEAGEPGVLMFDGSYLLSSKYLQSSLSMNSMLVNSLVDFASQFLSDDNAEKLNPVLKATDGFMLSGDAYVSTDLKTLSYNVSYILLINTKAENQVLMLTANGNEQEIQLNEMNLVYGDYAFGASATVNLNEETKDLFFVTDVNFENVPYHFSGTFINNTVTVTGDYNTQIDIRFEENNRTRGAVAFESFPVFLNKNSFALSGKSDFSYDQENGPQVNINQFEIEFDEENTTVMPKVLISGNVTKYGAQLKNVTYTDLYTTLEGYSDFRININDSIFDSAGLVLYIKNPLGAEDVTVEATVSNPDLIALNGKNFKDNLYLTVQAKTNALGLNRFASTKSEENNITASLFASGTISHPYVNVNVDKLALRNGRKTMIVDAVALLEDKLFTLESLNVHKGKMYMNNASAQFSLEDFKGQFEAFYHTEAGGKSVDLPFVVKIEEAQKVEGKLMPETFVASVESNGMSGRWFKKTLPFKITAMYSPDAVTVFSSENLGLFANYLSTGEVQLSINTPGMMKINGEGKFTKENNNLDLYEIDVDLKKLFEVLDLDSWVIVENGVAKGRVNYTGTWSDPVLSGEVGVYNPAARVPIVLPGRLWADYTPITIQNNEIYVNRNIYNVKNTPTVDADCRIVLNKWSYDYLEANLKTYKKEKVYGKLKTPIFVVDTDMSCDLYLYYGGDDALFEIDGSIFGENVYFESEVTSFISSGAVEDPDFEPLNLVTNLSITTGTHAAIAFNPVLRGVLQPNTKFNVVCDNKTSLYEIDGKFNVKSGDIAYLSRNFYIKSGNINFLPGEKLSNPKVTINAETREKDEKGQTVKIILDVENQNLLSMNPRFTANPAKSETEIMALLGQIALADSSNATDFLFAAGGYALQTSVVRKMENKLRNVLNFDIFSLRTNILQNTLAQSLSGGDFSEALNIGNLFDNSTVYVGKYLGSDLYVDAMFNVAYNNNGINNRFVPGNLLFQPEFGMELESPLVNIRWGIAPDINSLFNKQFVPSTSLTLSWKLSF